MYNYIYPCFNKVSLPLFIHPKSKKYKNLYNLYITLCSTNSTRDIMSPSIMGLYRLKPYTRD